MALAERTWERVGERKRDRARLIESAGVYMEEIFNVHLQIKLIVG